MRTCISCGTCCLPYWSPAVFAFPRMEQPAMRAIRALAALGTTGGCITALGEAAKRSASEDAQKGKRNAPEERVHEKENVPPTSK